MKSLHIRRVAAGLVIILLPVMAQAATISWTNSASSGAWEVGANWSGGIAPSNNITYLSNAVSKTVTISASTPADNLTVSNLFIEAPGGATNTLLLSGNTNPLVCLMLDTVRTIYVGKNANQAGAMTMDGGWLVTTNGPVSVGDTGVGIMTVSNGLWQGQSVNVGDRYTGGRGTLNIYGGTNLLTGSFIIGSKGGTMGSVLMAGGRLVTTNGAVNCWTYLGNYGVGDMTVSGGTWIADPVTIGNSTGGDGVLTLEEGTRVFASISAGYASRGTLNIKGGTNNIGALAVNNGSTGAGTVWMTGGLVVTTNAAGNSDCQFGVNGGGGGSMTVSNGTWLANAITLARGLGSSGNSLVIRGGQVLASAGLICGYGSGSSGSNNTILITGGILEAAGLYSYATGPNNVISNSGAVYQFATPTPAISPNSGSISINGGTISFRNVSTVNVQANWTVANGLSNITYFGANAFRLNSSTNATTPDQSYTFTTNSGARNYARLELINGPTCYRGGNVTIGSGGSILFSNTTAVLNGSLFVNNTGTVSVVDSTVTVTGACTIAENSIFNWTSNTLATVINVGGVLTLPTNATLNISGSINRNDQLTLFSAPNYDVIGSPVNWVVVPATHRVSLVGRVLVLRPRTSGFVFQIQ
jgi:hypothetical protein